MINESEPRKWSTKGINDGDQKKDQKWVLILGIKEKELTKWFPLRINDEYQKKDQKWTLITVIKRKGSKKVIFDEN